MNKWDVVRAWGRILSGRQPNLSIEITKECPLRCPGCYAYEPGHLGDAGPLRSLADFRGQELVDRVLALVDEHDPIHVSIVGGEPLVRYRELETLLPILSQRGVAVQLVTSAVRPIPAAWRHIHELQICVSIDGLQPEHDARRAPATYERILKHVEGHFVTVHCTITSQMAAREGSCEEFLAFWTARPEVKRVWFSLFTPQVGGTDPEILSPELKASLMAELKRLRPRFPKMILPDLAMEGYLNPPRSPAECVFARTTQCLSADLETAITPCQFGGSPDCAQCGCFASAGLNALAQHRLFGVVPLTAMLDGSEQVGRAAAWARGLVSREKPVTRSLPVVAPPMALPASDD